MIKQTIAIIMVSAFLSSCSSEAEVKTTNVVFIDHSDSAPTFEGNNPKRLKAQLVQIYTVANEGDEIIIYPIHKQTETAVPMIKYEKEINNS